MSRKIGLKFLAVAAVGVGFTAMMISSDGVAEETKPGLQPVAEAEAAPELALLMGDLQRLTHKMALSANEGNAKLAAFYMHESLEQLKAIQKDSPEYEGQPVALLIDRLAMPAYEPFQKSVTAETADKERMLTALDGVIQSCNQCHVATHHPLIKITRGTEVNPFNQSFKP
jgi:hypothetical protein